MWSARRRFLMGLSAVFAKGAAVASAAAGDQAGRTFLQITRYERMPEKFFKPYVDAIDKHYTPALATAPGLLMCKRFHHYDLPERSGSCCGKARRQPSGRTVNRPGI